MSEPEVVAVRRKGSNIFPRTVILEAGFSLLEMVATLAMMGIISGIAISNIQVLDDPLEDGTAQTIAFMKQARAKGISTTSAYQVMPMSTTQIIGRFAATCDAETFTNDERLVLDLPSTVRLASTSWSLCFSSRGIADDNLTFSLSDSDGRTKGVQVFLGGAVREYP